MGPLAPASGIVRCVSIDLGRRLIAAGVVPPEEVEAALFLSVVRGVSFARVLIDRGGISERDLEEELERMGGLALRQVAGAAELVARLPRPMCRRFAALPTRVDPETGVADIAAADPLDPHLAVEFAFHLGTQVRILRAPVAAVEEAIRRLELDEQEAPERIRPRRTTPAFPHGAPTSDIPPPVLEETPIPLVRKTTGAPGIPFMTERPPSSEQYAVPSGLPPLLTPRFSVTAPPPGGVREVRSPAPPKVSFPSSPAPPPVEELPSPGRKTRATPPYGTPVLVPSSPPAPVAPAFTPRRLPSDRPVLVVVDDEPLPPPRTISVRDGVRRPARPSLTMDLATLSGPKTTWSAPPDGSDEEAALPRPRRVRPPDGSGVLEGLRTATNRDEMIRLALRGMRLVAHRVAVFAVRRDGFHGWVCNVEFGDVEALRTVQVPLDQPNVLATAAASTLYLGPIPPTPVHEGLLSVMERASQDVAATAVRVGGRPALVLVADGFDDTMMGTRFLIELARAVGEALSRLIAPR